MSKLHPFASVLPVAYWPNQFEMPCGTVLEQPTPSFRDWDAHSLGLPEFNSLRDCYKCRQVVEEGGLRYIYLLRDGRDQTPLGEEMPSG